MDAVEVNDFVTDEKMKHELKSGPVMLVPPHMIASAGFSAIRPVCVKIFFLMFIGNYLTEQVYGLRHCRNLNPSVGLIKHVHGIVEVIVSTTKEVRSTI